MPIGSALDKRKNNVKLTLENWKTVLNKISMYDHKYEEDRLGTRTTMKTVPSKELQEFIEECMQLQRQSDIAEIRETINKLRLSLPKIKKLEVGDFEWFPNKVFTGDVAEVGRQTGYLEALTRLLTMYSPKE